MLKADRKRKIKADLSIVVSQLSSSSSISHFRFSTQRSLLLKSQARPKLPRPGGVQVGPIFGLKSNINGQSSAASFALRFPNENSLISSTLSKTFEPLLIKELTQSGPGRLKLFLLHVDFQSVPVPSGLRKFQT